MTGAAVRELTAVASPAEVQALAADDRRFTSLARLYGQAGLQALRQSHVVVIGIGGVGSWAAEALARSAIGRLTLIDMDHVAESNINRQVHALTSTLGASKIGVMAARIADIAPDCRVDLVDEYIDADNLRTLVPQADVVIDAIDPPRAKAALIAWAREQKRALIVCGAAGGRTDPLRLRCEDLSRTRGDALLSSVRARLRREHGFTRDPGKKFGVDAIFSDEQAPRLAESGDGDGSGAEGDAIAADIRSNTGAPLNCSGYGSVVGVTAAIGLAAAQWAVNRLARRR